MTTGDDRYDARHRARTPWGVLGTTLGLIAIILALVLNSCSFTETPSATCTSTPGPVGPAGATGIAGLSAYDVWIELGNTGTEQDFLDSLVGEPGKNGFSGTNGFTPAAGDHGHSAYQLWLDAGHTGSVQDFLDSLRGVAGADGVVGQTGATGAQGLSAYELWVLEGGIGDEAAFLADLEGDIGPQGIQGLQGVKGDTGAPGSCTPGDTGATGATGETGPAGPQGEVGPVGPTGPQGETGPAGPKGDTGATGPAGTSGLGDSGSFWDTTLQGYNGEVSTEVDAAHPIYLSDADTANNVGVSIERCAGDQTKPAGYPVTPKSCITFTHAGVYNLAFSAQLLRTQGGGASEISIWLRRNGVNVPMTNTDVTLQSNSQKLVAAWNFFVPVTCAAGECDDYQLMWSASSAYSNLWYEGGQSAPARPETPSVILTVNQVN